MGPRSKEEIAQELREAEAYLADTQVELDVARGKNNAAMDNIRRLQDELENAK